jgi:P27 family predicted phage terminase small subunit
VAKKKGKSSRPAAPKHLSAEARAVWGQYVEAYDFEPESLPVLQALCEWFDRRLEARALLKAEGIVVKTRLGESRPHPANALERHASTMVLKHARHLGIDLEPIQDRPGPGRG